MHHFLSSLILLVFLSQVESQANREQFVQLYSTADISGSPDLTVAEREFNHTIIASIVYYKVDGLYLTTMNKLINQILILNYLNCNHYRWTLEHYDHWVVIRRQILFGIGAACLPLPTVAGRSLFFTSLGPEDQATPQINLYPQACFLGTPNIHRGSLSFLSSRIFGSSFFSGTTSYTRRRIPKDLISALPQHQACLTWDAVLLFFKSTNTGIVGSVQLGCPSANETFPNVVEHLFVSKEFNFNYVEICSGRCSILTILGQ